MTAHHSFADIAVALKVQAGELAHRVEHTEYTAAKIDLPVGVAERVINDQREHARLVGLAHEIIKGLIPVEAAVRCLINDIEGRR